MLKICSAHDEREGPPITAEHQSMKCIPRPHDEFRRRFGYWPRILIENPERMMDERKERLVAREVFHPTANMIGKVLKVL